MFIAGESESLGGFLPRTQSPPSGELEMMLDTTTMSVDDMKHVRQVCKTLQHGVTL